MFDEWLARNKERDHDKERILRMAHTIDGHVKDGLAQGESVDVGGTWLLERRHVSAEH